MRLDKKLIERAIEDGHKIAGKICNARTVDEVDKLPKEIEEYSDFVNENFGVLDNFSQNNERYCEPTFYIHMAAKTKSDHLYYYASNPDAGNGGADDFEYYLDSNAWLEGKENAEL